ncbi:GntR family transcriptional regulator [Vagococcus bubulae]|uniref:GntR family transcriptional regulator n=1 Tax=Vagococcus bubulae TaxID=1977868 RepID=UPI001402104C|nr:GntR family transcriptional regulator [Vagococcus bubulae]
MRKGKTQKLVYEYVKKQIETDTWLNGYHIVEQDLANELQVSRTPIRSAIDQLIDEKYLRKEANRGVVVKKERISNKEFMERTQLIELLCSHYLFQLQIKEYLIDDQSFLPLEDLEKQSSDKEYHYDLFWRKFLSPLSNELMKLTILTQIASIKLVDFPNVSVEFLYDETYKLSQKLPMLLLEKKFEVARKEIRVYINRLNLELIDQQI